MVGREYPCDVAEEGRNESRVLRVLESQELDLRAHDLAPPKVIGESEECGEFHITLAVALEVVKET